MSLNFTDYLSGYRQIALFALHGQAGKASKPADLMPTVRLAREVLPVPLLLAVCLTWIFHELWGACCDPKG
jgi:hypothetical protein